jgi:hypothetical protein
MIKTKIKSKTKRQIDAEEKRCFWQNHIQGWRLRGINQADYCREHGLKETAFTYWKGKLTHESAAFLNTSANSDASSASSAPSSSSSSASSSSAASRSSISLVPVGLKVNIEPSPQRNGGPPITQPLGPKPLVVVVDSHFRIEVSGDFEPAILGKLMSTLRQL